MSKSLTTSEATALTTWPVNPAASFTFGRLPRWSLSWIVAGALVALLPACQGLKTAAPLRTDVGRTASDLDKAQQAWQVMQRENPGTASAQRALWKYDGAASETIVPYMHGCLEKPKTVRAVMKILKGTQ